MDALIKDLRFGWKLLVKEKGYTLTVLLTLGLTIGANAAIFTVVNSVLLRPLPVPEADRIVLLYNSYPGAGVERTGAGAADYYDRLAELDCFEEQALFRDRSHAFGEGETPERLRGMAVTPSLFRLLLTEPRLGRNFSEEEGEIGQEQKVILSHGLWRQLGGTEEVLGRELLLNGEAFEVVGVMPEGFLFMDPDVRLWTPLAFTDEQKEARHSNNWTMIARLKPGATPAIAQQQIDALNARNLDRFPEFRELLTNAGFHTGVLSLQDEIVRDIKSTLYLLWGGVVFVFLIGGVNLANLTLVRSTGRLKELVTRYTLGAGRARVIRQVMTESLLLTGLGGGLGLVCGALFLRAFAALGLDQIPRGHEISLDMSTVFLALALTALIGVVLGVIPALSVMRSDPSTVLREEGRSGTGGRGVRLLRRGLVTSQVAIAFVLLIGAGLLLESFRRILEIDPGFEPDSLLAAWVHLPSARYAGGSDLQSFAERALDRLGSLPGVERAAATSVLPFGGDYSDSVILAEGYVMEPGESLISPNRVEATPGYFETMGISLVRGRFFDERDHAGSSLKAIVDERLARKFWGDSDPIGRRMFQPASAENLLDPGENPDWITVVGVVRDIKLRGLVDSEGRVGTYYFPFAQDPARVFAFTLRTSVEPESLIPSLRREIAALDPELPVSSARTMQERMDLSLVSRRSSMTLTLGFGAVALFLASLGIYGVLAYVVTRRRKEIGIRMALGSSGRKIFHMVLREGLVILSFGLALGAAGAVALSRTLESQLFGVTATDPAVLVAGAAVLLASALCASLLPAARATRINPAVVLSD